MPTGEKNYFYFTGLGYNFNTYSSMVRVSCYIFLITQFKLPKKIFFIRVPEKCLSNDYRIVITRARMKLHIFSIYPN